jgi:hypothetical protein
MEKAWLAFCKPCDMEADIVSASLTWLIYMAQVVVDETGQINDSQIVIMSVLT